MKGFFKQSKLRLVSAVFAFLMLASVARADVWLVAYCGSDVLGTYTAINISDDVGTDGENIVLVWELDC